MGWPLIVAGATAAVGAYGSYKNQDVSKKRYRRYRKQAFAEFSKWFKDIKRLRERSLRSARYEKGQALSTLKGMEAKQLGMTQKVFAGQRERNNRRLEQMIASNTTALAGAGLSGSTLDAGMRRQAISAGMQEDLAITGQQAALDTGIVGASRGAQAGVHASMVETNVNNQFAQAQFGARQAKTSFLMGLMTGGPGSSTGAALAGGVGGLGAGMGMVGSFDLHRWMTDYKPMDWEEV